MSFLEALQKLHPKYENVLKTTQNLPAGFPYTERPVELIFILLSGGENLAMKKRYLSDVLVDWVGNWELKHTKKGKEHKWPSPSTILTVMRRFLAATREYMGWCFTIGDFQHNGGFAAYFSALCDQRQKVDVSIKCRV